MTVAIFDPNADQGRFRHSTRGEAPSRTYAILFTPRSGSSWLTSILAATRVMGTPSEWFNPTLMPTSSRAKGARDLDQFIAAISRHEAHGNIFGFEITHHQLKAVFKTDAAFMARFRDATFFWLTRQDIVAQGVSLDKMVATKISHAANSGPAQIERGDRDYDYDDTRIKKWIQHIRAAEDDTERMIAAYGLNVFRLTYEAITAAGAAETAAFFAAALGVRLPPQAEINSPHRKIATEKNEVFQARFRAEHKRFVARITAERAEMVARCTALLPAAQNEERG